MHIGDDNGSCRKRRFSLKATRWLAGRVLPSIPSLLILFAVSSALAESRNPSASGDPITVTAGSITHSKQKKRTQAHNDVKINYQGRVISGDVGVINHETGIGYLIGHVKVSEKEAVIDGEKVEFNLNTGEGRLRNAQGRLGDSFYFTGERIDRLEPDHFTLVNGSCSTCPFPDQDWRIEASWVDLTVEGYAYAEGMIFRAGSVPILYLPYFIMPVKTTRATGFLIPSFAYSQDNGFNISNSFFWAMTDYMDTTITHHHRGNDGEGADLEFRYILSPTTRGQLNTEYFYVMEPEETKGNELWKILYSHNQLLPFGIENMTKVDMESKDSLARRWEDDLTSRTRRYSDSFFLLRRNWTSRSLSLTARTKRSVIPGVGDQVDELPAISFTNQKESLFGLPVYWSLESGYTYFSTSQAAVEPSTGVDQFKVNRMDVFPGLSALLSPAPWLSLEPEIKYRATTYSAWIDETGDIVEEPFIRNYYTASTVLTGPRFYRIFDRDQGEKLKHLITPKLSWSFIPDYDYDGVNREKVKPIDAVDISAPRNVATFSLVNQLLFKESGGAEASIVERIKLTIEQSYDFNEADREETPESPSKPLLPTVVGLKTRPAHWLMLNANAEYSIDDSRLERTHVELGLNIGEVFHFALDRVGSYPDEAWDTAYMEFVLPGGVRADFSAIYNEKEAFINDASVRFFYKAGCWGIGISGLYKKKNVIDAPGGPTISEETKIMFSIDLLGMGDTLGEVAKPLARRKL